MALNGVELHHVGIRLGPADAEIENARRFYQDVLGLSPDPGRPRMPSIAGYWMDIGAAGQIHLMGVSGMSRFAHGPDEDPSLPHVAFGVPDVQAAKAELTRLGVAYFVVRGAVGPEAEQLFLRDPAGTLIELHQAGTCRCARPAPSPAATA